MFQNPFFKTQQASSPKNSGYTSVQRPSVQDIMNKYKSPQTEKASIINEQILGSLNESSNFLNEESRHDKLFINPIQPKFDLEQPAKKDAIVRLTFGEEQQKLQISNQQKLSQKLLTEDDLYDDMSNLKDKVTSMLQRYSIALKAPDNQNKRNIKTMLEQDANLVAQEYTQIVEKFNNPDLSAISIAESTMPQQKEQQLTQMFNLVEEFLTKFKNISQQQQEKSQLLRSRIHREPQNQFQRNEKSKQFTFASAQNSKHSSQAVKFKAQAQFAQQSSLEESNYVNTQELQNTNQVNNFQQNNQFKQQQSNAINQNQLDMTVYQTFPRMDDSFYDAKQISMFRINQKLTALKEKLQQELQQENMPYTQKILNEMISNLQEIINTQDYQLVKTIIFRIEQGIQQLSKNKEGSINLYKYINKALLNSKMKTDLFQQRSSMPLEYQTPLKFEQVNQQNQQRNTLSQVQQQISFRPNQEQTNERLSQIKQNDFNQYYESRPSYNSDIRLSEQNTQYTKFELSLDKQEKNQNGQFKQNQMERLSENTRQSDMERLSDQTMKRQFFDAALSIKNKLPQNHPGRNIMVSDLYEDFTKQNSTDILQFLQKYFDLQFQ